MAPRRYAAAASCLFVAASTQAFTESRVPLSVPPELCDLRVVADEKSGDVRLSWSGGTPPFTVVRSETEDFRHAKDLEVVAPTVRSNGFEDRRAFSTDKRFFYQVYDQNSPPDIFEFSPDGGLPGAEITVRGVGFCSDCGKIGVYIGGVEAPVKLECGFLGFKFKTPTNAMTGYLVVAAPGGVADAGMEAEDECRGKPRRPRSW